ncbi:MAG: hypothetical protein DRJ61_06880 [Acidobacteria bacterium]|nr:MAG: hypothetical protein DRJ61_06880 [Acidobacteriota bacterium]
MTETLLSVDPDAAFDAVAHDQVGGPYQVPAELVRLVLGLGATSVDVQCRRSRVVVDAPGAVLPESAIEALRRASSQGEDVVRLQALAALEDLDASALGWAVGLRPRRLVIRSWVRGRATILKAGGREAFHLSYDEGPQEDGVFIELTRPKLNLKRANRWLEIACRFAAVPVVVNGRNVQRDMDSGCFRARIESPLPAVIGLGVNLSAPRLWLLRHGVVATRIGVPNWPPFEAAVELQGLVQGRASAAQLREAMTPYLQALISRVVELTLRVVPRLSELSADHRQRITSSLFKAAERGLALEAIRQSPLVEIVDSDTKRWVSLEALEQWPGPLPGVLGNDAKPGEIETPHMLLGPGERERVAALIGRTLPGAVVRPIGSAPGLRRSARVVLEFIQGLLGPRPIPDSRLTHEERGLIEALEGALRVGGRPVAVCLCPGRRASRMSGRRLVLARNRPETLAAVRVVAESPGWIYVVAVAMKGPDCTVASEIRSAWSLRNSGGLV